MAKARVVSSLVTGSIGPAGGLAASPEFARMAMVANQLKEAQQSQTRETNALPFAGGVAITGIQLPAGSVTKVSHPLRKLPQGYLMTRMVNGANIFQSAVDANSITFNNPGGGAVTIDIWIY